MYFVCCCGDTRLSCEKRCDSRYRYNVEWDEMYYQGRTQTQYNTQILSRGGRLIRINKRHQRIQKNVER